MNGIIRIEFQVVDGQLKLAVSAPMQTEDEKRLSIHVLASAIPIVSNYNTTLIVPPHVKNGNGIPPLSAIN